jgi:hypothetical protein
MTTQTHPALADEALREILIRIEAHRDARSWHEDAELWVIYDRTVTETDRNLRKAMRKYAVPGVERLGARVFMTVALPEGEQDSEIRSPHQLLNRFVTNVVFSKEPAPQQMAGLLKSAQGIVAFAFASEAFGTENPDLQRQMMDGTLYLGDIAGHPAVHENRAVVCVDTHHRKHFVMRRNGSPPTSELDCAILGGPVPVNLHLLFDMIQDTVPQSQKEYDARYPYQGPVF